MKIIVYILTVLFLIANDIKRKKKPFDDKGKPFSLKSNWWNTRWDDAVSWIVGGAIGALLSSELAVPIINKYLEWPQLAEGAIDLTSVMICTFLGSKIFEKISSLV